jgi:predicted Rossmann fold nucleotide-binding protein DprA/Smf involved in DNA uptake
MDLATIEQQTEFGAIRFAELHEAWAVAEMTATRLTSRELEAELANARRGPTVMRNVWNRFLHRVRAFEVLETSTGLPEALGSGAGGSDARRRREAARTERTLAAVTKRPGISIPELAEEIGATRKQLHQLLPKLEREGMVEETRSGGWRPGPAGRRFESAGPGQED